MVYVDRYGRTHKMVDRTKGFLGVYYNVKYWTRKIYWRIRQYLRDLRKKYFHTNYTGTYVIRNGKSVKISSSAGVHDIWIKKYPMSFWSRLSEKRFYKKVEAEGKLHEVDDLAYAKSLFKD